MPKTTPAFPFYQQIQRGTAPGSAEGPKLTAEELLAAEKKLKSLPQADAIAAWRDVMDVHKSAMDPEFVARLTERLNDAANEVRPSNRYRSTMLSLRVQKAQLEGDIAQAALIAAHKTAVREAIAAQVEDAEPLLALANSIHTATELYLFTSAWTTTLLSDGSIDSIRLQRLERAMDEARFNMATGDALAPYIAYATAPAIEAEDTFPSVKGFSRAEVSAKVSEAAARAGAGTRIYQAEAMRGPAYQKVIDAIINDPALAALRHQVRTVRGIEEDLQKGSQSLRGGAVITEKSLSTMAVAHPYVEALYELTQRTARNLGFRNGTTLVLSSGSPNAFVYTANMDEPRVTFYTSLVEKFWDEQKNDWLTVYRGADGKLSKDPNAGEPVKLGEKLIEAVLVHELGHIRDGVVETDTMLIALFQRVGQDIFSQHAAAQGMGPEEVDAKVKELTDKLGKAVGICNCSFHQGAIRSLMGKVEIKGDVSPRAARGAMASLMSKLSGNKVDPQEIDVAELESFIRKLEALGRVAEATADRYAIAYQGTAEWTSVVHSGFNLSLQPAPLADLKVDAALRIINMGPESYARAMLEDVANNRLPYAAAAAVKGTSHPVGPARIMHAYLFTREQDGAFAAVRELNELEPDLQLLGIIQQYEREMEALEQEAAQIKPLAGVSLTTDLVSQIQLRNQKEAVRKEMQPLLSVFEELLNAAPLSDPNHPFLTRALDFMDEGGTLLGDGAAFTTVLEHLQARLSEALESTDLPEEKLVLQEYQERVEDLLSPESESPEPMNLMQLLMNMAKRAP